LALRFPRPQHEGHESTRACMEWTADKIALAELVSKKTQVDAQFKAMDEFTYARALLDEDVRARVDAFHEQASELEQALAALDAHERYDFVFSCMLRGALADK
jgi:hypothetical protein